MKEQLNQILSQALGQVSSVTSQQELEAARVKFLGKKGELTGILRGMGKLSAEERPVIGQLANEVRAQIEQAIEKAQQDMAQRLIAAKLEKEQIDVTMPGQKVLLGKQHPLNTVLHELYDIFTGMGFSIAEGPEVEYDYYNFEALNIPKNHPARDTQDTFYINDNIVLRTQTSPMQVRTMEKQRPPIRVIAPGRVYRSDAVDATHSPVFHQIEGLVVEDVYKRQVGIKTAVSHTGCNTHTMGPVHGLGIPGAFGHILKIAAGIPAQLHIAHPGQNGNKLRTGQRIFRMEIAVLPALEQAPLTGIQNIQICPILIVHIPIGQAICLSLIHIFAFPVSGY